MSSAVKSDTPRVCARDACDEVCPTRRHRYCATRCRRLAEGDRRAARERAATAAALAESKARVVEQVEQLYYLAAAARAAGVARSTAYRWLDTDPAFAAEVDVARRIAADMREIDVMAAARTRDWDQLRAAVTVCKRIDANELRRVRAGDRSDRHDRHAARDTPAEEIPAAECDEALEWARRPLLVAV